MRTICRDPVIAQAFSAIDGTSMLAAIAAGLSILSSILFSFSVPVELSLVPLLLPLVIPVFVYKPLFEVSFAGGFLALVVGMGYTFPPSLHLPLLGLVLTMGLAAACQIYDQTQPQPGDLSFVRRYIPLHAVWHVLAGYSVCELVALLVRANLHGQ